MGTWLIIGGLVVVGAVVVYLANKLEKKLGEAGQ
ncbi:hypothetical protein LCGC14_2781480, partial [marine sediment metagenome]